MMFSSVKIYKGVFIMREDIENVINEKLEEIAAKENNKDNKEPNTEPKKN